MYDLYDDQIRSLLGGQKTRQRILYISCEFLLVLGLIANSRLLIIPYHLMEQSTSQ